MLLFSTLLDINESVQKDDFIRLAIEWNKRTPFLENRIEGLDWKGERNIRFGTETCWMGIEEYRNANIIAIRHEMINEGVIWDTDMVMDFNAMRLAIRLDRSYTEDVFSTTKQFSAPFFMRMLIEKGFLEPDGDLAITHEPIMVGREELDRLSDIIMGRRQYRLPVVYVSRTCYDKEPVNVRSLAWRLKGVAHVLVQESRTTNPELRKRCDSRNEYYGAVGIYYPFPTGNHEKCLYRSSKGFDSFLMERVIQKVLLYCNSQRYDALYTWQGVRAALLQDKLINQKQKRKAAEEAQLKAEQETAQLIEAQDEAERAIRKKAADDARFEADQILEAFDETVQGMENRIDEMSKVIATLQFENQGMKNKLDSLDTIPVLYMGEEYEFYQGEYKDLLLEVLSEALKGLPPNSRRHDVVKDVIQANDYRRLGETRSARLKNIMRTYDGMTSRIQKELAELGFVISEDGKHYKLTYYGDSRYLFTLAKTPSDGRSGPNTGQKMLKMSF